MTPRSSSSDGPAEGPGSRVVSRVLSRAALRSSVLPPPQSELLLETGDAGGLEADDATSALVRPGHGGRPKAPGRFFCVDDRKLLLRGVTYGTFARHPDGHDYPDREVVASDFAGMARWGFNAVRTYTPPPAWLLDLAVENGLYVLVGLSWTQHVTFLDDRALQRDIRASVAKGARACAEHPALLGFSVGNEIPSPIVRWHGPRRVEGFIGDLRNIVKGIDPEALVTYVNYPTTEYLQLRFLDFHSFNVFLESQERLESYLARLHNIADDRPLVMAEIGLDSRRNGDMIQASSLEWQVTSSLRSGCAGAFIFKWTDEWHRGGFAVEDWNFGLTTADREPKPALSVVSRAFAKGPFPVSDSWPRISVVVCTYNGSRTIGQTLEKVTALPYPDFEVIVVSDGSTDSTTDVCCEFDVRLITTENKGLGSARNTGAKAANGEIIAYIDDDAFPDPHWLHYLAATYRDGDWAAVGGPNVLPPGSSHVSEWVYHSPGGATHVLLSDTEAEHLPGCNLSVRKSCLEEIEGFDPQFDAAGDDVDFCWRLQGRGWKLGFHPGAMVWHHRRDSMRRYWRQQVGYGRAEAKLERKWPEKYNSAGHLSWEGRLYGPGQFQGSGWGASRIYYGTWGSAPFQALYHSTPGSVLSLAMMPEWHLLVAQLSLLSLLGLLWPPLLLALPFAILSLAIPFGQAVRLSSKAQESRSPSGFWDRVRFVSATTWLHLLQPVGRLWGRFGEGLTPWRRLGLSGWTLPRRSLASLWSETWHDPATWVSHLYDALAGLGVRVVVATVTDRWDIEVRAGLFGGARARVTVEEHGGGRQYVRFRAWPWLRFRFVSSGVIAFGVLSGLAFAAGETLVGAVLGSVSLSVALLIAFKCGAAEATLLRVIRSLE